RHVDRDLDRQGLLTSADGGKSSPSRVRFRPPSPLTFRFRVVPSETASTYSRPLLGAGGNLEPWPSECKRSERRSAESAHVLFQTDVWAKPELLRVGIASDALVELTQE